MNWIYDRQPDRPGIYIVKLKSGEVLHMRWCKCWGCVLDPQTGEIYQYNRNDDVVCWMEGGEDDK